MKARRFKYNINIVREFTKYSNNRTSYGVVIPFENDGQRTSLPMLRYLHFSVKIHKISGSMSLWQQKHWNRWRMSNMYERQMHSLVKAITKPSVQNENKVEVDPFETILNNDRLVDGQKARQQVKNRQTIEVMRQLLLVDIYIDECKNGKSDANDEEDKKEDPEQSSLPKPSKQRSIFSISEKTMAAKTPTYVSHKDAMNHVKPLVEIDRQMDRCQQKQTKQDSMSLIQDMLAIDNEMDNGAYVSVAERLRKQQKRLASQETYTTKIVTNQRRSIFSKEAKEMARTASNNALQNLVTAAETIHDSTPIPISLPTLPTTTPPPSPLSSKLTPAPRRSIFTKAEKQSARNIYSFHDDNGAVADSISARSYSVPI